ncbi:cupin domain-containing protein [Deinococcus navajonensis]|uniref:Cupin domain-containing protein n=1 Tax=Deinococcus navajonensis TaxID=309884 RepID=A0ABV8XRD2_9DEIO
MSLISTASAAHYLWADVCEGWHLARTSTLSVIQERRPPGTAETRHRHLRVRQFFYVLGGVLILELDGAAHAVPAGHGLEIRPGQAHQARNDSSETVDFLVISDGSSREDRQNA